MHNSYKKRDLEPEWKSIIHKMNGMMKQVMILEINDNRQAINDFKNKEIEVRRDIELFLKKINEIRIDIVLKKSK